MTAFWVKSSSLLGAGGSGRIRILQARSICMCIAGRRELVGGVIVGDEGDETRKVAK